MRQAIIVVPIFFLLLIVIYLFTPISPEKAAYESFISADAPIVITQYDLKTRVAEFRESRLGQAMANLKYDLIGSELGFSDADVAQFLEVKNDFLNGYENPLIQKLIGSEVTLAMFPFEPENSGDIGEQFVNHLLLISRPSADARLMDVAAWAGTAGGRMTSVRYGSHDLSRMILEDNRRISVVRVEDLLVMSLNEQVLRRSLDIYDSRQGGLLDNEEYSRNIDHFDGASFIGYINLDDFSERINRATQMALNADESFRLIDEAKLSRHKSGLFGAWREKDAIVDKAYISFDQELLDQRSRALLGGERDLPSTYKKVAADTVFYHWSNQFNPKPFFDYLEQSPSPLTDSEQQQTIEQITAITGLSVDQLASLIDSEVTLAVRSFNQKELVPLPRFLLSVKSGDVDKLKAAVNKLIDHYGVPVRRKKMGQTELISWGGVVGIGSVLPTLSFAKESFIISSNREQIKRFIGVEQARSLADHESFKAMSAGLLRPSHSITYLDFGRATGMIKEMASWGGTMLALKDRELARKSKVLIEELINPMLDGLAMYSLIGSRKFIDGSNIVYESRTIIEDGNE